MSDGRLGSDVDEPVWSDASDGSDGSDESNPHLSVSASSTESNVAGGDGICASEIKGRQYRGVRYLPLHYEELEEFGDSDDYPESSEGGLSCLVDPPCVPQVDYIAGSSAIMFGALLRSGGTLSWPVLAARYGWTVLWALVAGVFTQPLINTEPRRRILATGESIFRAFTRIGSYWPWVFLAGGLISLGWPGWTVDAAQVATVVPGPDGMVTLFGASSTMWKLITATLTSAIWLSY